MSAEVVVTVLWDPDRGTRDDRGRWVVACHRNGVRMWRRWFDYLRDKETAVRYAIDECRALADSGVECTLMTYTRERMVNDWTTRFTTRPARAARP